MAAKKGFVQDGWSIWIKKIVSFKLKKHLVKRRMDGCTSHNSF